MTPPFLSSVGTKDLGASSFSLVNGQRPSLDCKRVKSVQDVRHNREGAADRKIGVTTSAGKRRLLLCFYRGKESQGARNRQSIHQLNPANLRGNATGRPAREWNLMQLRLGCLNVLKKKTQGDKCDQQLSIHCVGLLEVRLPETKIWKS